MKRFLKLILFIGTFVLILALIGFIAIKIGQDRLTGEQGASAEYSILRNAVSPITGEQELGDQFVRDRLKSLYSASAHLLAVQVLDRNGLVLWKMPDDSPYFASPASNPGSVFRAPGMSTVIYMTPLPDGMKLMALYATLTQADISRILLPPIIILAIWIILLVVLQITLKEKTEPNPLTTPERAENLKEEASVEELIEHAPPEEPLFEPTDEAILGEAPIMESVQEAAQEEEPVPETSEPESEPEPEPEPRPQPEPVLESKAEAPRIQRETETQEIVEPVEEEPARETQMAQVPQVAAPSEKIEEEGEFITPPPQETPVSQPQELFPPTIRSHALEQSLAAELSRNQGIALILILCELSGENDPSALALGVTIRDYFATDSLVFELGRGCYAALLPGSDAGSSLKLAVDLDDVLTTTASLYKDLADEPPFYFGISERYGRAIEPERLYKEAYAALKHAHESGSRILAFKPAIPVS